VQIGQAAVALVDVEPVAGIELVRDHEPDVAHRQVVDEAAVRSVEERDDGERRGAPQAERLDEEVERQPGIDDVLDDDDVTAADLYVEILEEPDGRVAAGRAPGVAGQLDELQVVQDRQRAGEVGEEDEARFERRDEQGLQPLVLAGQLGPELADARLDLGSAQVDLADPAVGGYDASFRRYR
jgi:hypothetical protein